jgi:tetratricopeptide (TPR) repeat protein
VEFDAEIPDPEDLKISGDLSIILAASKTAPKKQGYFLQVGGIGNTSAVIQKREDFLASVDFKLEPGRKYTVRAEKEAGNLRLFCNGKLLISYNDIFYLAGGYCGIYTFGKGKKFSNIRIYRKEIPELVPPTIEGDSFYRESRRSKGKERIHFLELAREAYTKVYESNLSTALSSEVLLKRAYVNSKLGKTAEAVHDAILLGGFGETLDLLMLKGLLAFQSADYKNAYRIYSKAFKKYPESKVTTVAHLTGNLAGKYSTAIPEELKQKLWRLCAVNYSSSSFRCSAKHLKKLDFVRGIKFSLIDCSGNSITSLEPLKNLPLKHLDCADNQISSLAPLRGIKLESLECHNNPITDISPLKDMPLKTLTLNGCTELKDISLLKNCRSLERLTVPAHIKNLDFLKKMPNLKYVNTKWDNWKTTVDEFFAERK